MIQYKYNPQNAPAEELLATFTAREMLLESILKEIKKQTKAKTNQHYLYIGPRGVGKTNFLKMIYLNTKSDEEINEKWLPVQFAEEEYSINNLRELLEKILEILIEEVHDDALSLFYENIKDDNKDEVIQEKIIETLKAYLKRNSRKLIALIDNLDLILSDQFNDDAGVKRLRDILMNDSFLMIIAAAPTYFEEISSYDKPLYNFFKIKNLDELNENEIEELIIKRAKYEKNDELLKRLDQFQPKLKAIRHLTGGNPRLILMLYQLLSLSEFNEVKDYLNSLLDDLTPYYQYKMKWLSKQQRKIFESMAKLNKAATPTEISKNSRLPVNIVTSNLKRLLDEGYIKTAKQERRKSTFYIISERLFRIWYQMRFSRKLKKRIELFIEFIRLWYSEEELETEIGNLSQKFETYFVDKDMMKAKNVIEHLDYIAEACFEPRIKEEIKDQVIRMMVNVGDFHSAEERLLSKISISKNTPKELSYYLLMLGIVNSAKGDFENGLKYIEDALIKDPNNPEAWSFKGLSLRFFDNYTEALKCYDKAITFKPEDYISWEGKGSTLYGLKRYEEALESYNKSIGFRHDYYLAFEGKGNTLNKLEKYEDALQCYNKAIEFKPDNYLSFQKRGNTLKKLKRYEEALKSYDKAIELNPNNYFVPTLKGNILLKLGSYEKALQSYNNALSIKPDFDMALGNRGNVLMKLGKYTESIENYEKILEKKPNDEKGWYNKGLALIKLNKYEEALSNFDKALNIKPDLYLPIANKGVALYFLGRNTKALECFNKAIKLIYKNEDEANDVLLVSLYMASLINIKENNLEDAKNKFSELLKYYQKYKNIGDKNEILISLFHSTLTKDNFIFISDLFKEIKKYELKNEDQLLEPYRIAVEYFKSDKDQEIIDRLNPEVRETVENIIKEAEAKK